MMIQNDLQCLIFKITLRQLKHLIFSDTFVLTLEYQKKVTSVNMIRSVYKRYMKKAVVMFTVFLIIDIILMAVLLNFNGGKDFVVLFLPAMFVEIAVYGSFILYEVSKKGGNKTD